MSTPSEPQREHPSTYMVQNRSIEEEMKRLQAQDQMLNSSMGGLLAEQEDPARFKRVLDVGCGTGGWLIELARTYPSMNRLVGVDPSGAILDFARAQARAMQVEDRVEFHIMDALRRLDFPNASFDLVNQRLGISWLRTWDWPKLLQEYQRVTRRGGVIRITESTWTDEHGMSPALVQLGNLSMQAFYHAGHSFHPTSDGVTGELERLLRQHGLGQVQSRTCVIEYPAGTPEGQLFIEDMTRLFSVLKPFMQKWTRLPDDYDEIYQRMVQEIHQPSFVGRMHLLTAWGSKV